LEFQDSSFKSERDVVRVLSLPVLALIPVMVSDPKGNGTSRRRRSFALFGALLLVIVSAAALFVLRGRL
jgi:hypothetical protein